MGLLRRYVRVNFGGGASGSGSAPGIISLLAGEEAAAAAASGIRGAAFGLGKVKDGAFSFAALLTALESDTESNILSTPSLLTLDNEEASILVGQELYEFQFTSIDFHGCLWISMDFNGSV